MVLPRSTSSSYPHPSCEELRSHTRSFYSLLHSFFLARPSLSAEKITTWSGQLRSSSRLPCFWLIPSTSVQNLISVGPMVGANCSRVRVGVWRTIERILLSPSVLRSYCPQVPFLCFSFLVISLTLKSTKTFGTRFSEHCIR